jgi:hypothetical protein
MAGPPGDRAASTTKLEGTPPVEGSSQDSVTVLPDTVAAKDSGGPGAMAAVTETLATASRRPKAVRANTLLPHQ